jgi:hypothetical protein
MIYLLQLEDGATKVETPQQKYQRLQHEIRELTEDVAKIKVGQCTQKIGHQTQKSRSTSGDISTKLHTEFTR